MTSNMAEQKSTAFYFRTESGFTELEITGVKETGRELGRGAYGVVTESVWWGTKCVTKRLHNILSIEAKSKHASDFLAECYTWSRLRHPHVVQFLGLLFEDNEPLPVIVLELLSTSLRVHIESHNRLEFLLPDKLVVLHHVILGLAYLHGLRHIHRDLTTNNILIDTASWHAKISDFGVTRVLADERIRSTASSIVPGAEAFMAPEAFELSSQFTYEFDVFSYGCVVVGTLGHCWPQPGVAKRKVNGKLVALSECERRQIYIDQFSSEEKGLLVGIVEHCLEEEADDRPSSLSLAEEIGQLRFSLKREDKTSEDKYKEVVELNSDLQQELEKATSELQVAKAELEELREDNALLHRSKEELVLAQEECYNNLIKKNEEMERTVRMLRDKASAPALAEEFTVSSTVASDDSWVKVQPDDLSEFPQTPSEDVTVPSSGVSNQQDLPSPVPTPRESLDEARHKMSETVSLSSLSAGIDYLPFTRELTATEPTVAGAIRFHKKGERFYEFNPWYSAPVLIEHKKWPSCENYYLARRFEGSPLGNAIHECMTPQEAFKLSCASDAHLSETNNWSNLRFGVMNLCQESKFDQHPELQTLLRSTGKRELVYHTRTDPFRGDGGDGSGENELGKKLMQIRSYLLPY